MQRNTGNPKRPARSSVRSYNGDYDRARTQGSLRPAAHFTRSRRRRSLVSRIKSFFLSLSPLNRRILAVAAGVLLLLIVLLLIINSAGGNRDAKRQALAYTTIGPTATPTAAPTEAAEDLFAALPEQTEAPESAQFTPIVTALPELAAGAETWKSGAYAPQPEGPGYLPVFKKANTTEKVIAITVDDCFQTANLKEIVQLAENVNGKLTIFPIGELLKREALQEVIRHAHSIGFEIENHTFTHSSLYNETDEGLAKQIFNQDRAVDYILGVDYHTHFLRPRGGDDRNDIRTHAYIQQIGYYGIAHWSISGSGSSVDSLKKTIAPGEVYLFHCTDKDLEKLRQFIPYTAQQGYRLVTMNELFGYQKNAEAPLTDDPLTREVVALGPYERDYKTIKKPTYSYAAYQVQEKLIELGFLSGKPDGVFGAGSEKAVQQWQRSIGVEPDGVLTPELQHRLLDD